MLWVMEGKLEIGEDVLSLGVVGGVVLRRQWSNVT